MHKVSANVGCRMKHPSPIRAVRACKHHPKHLGPNGYASWHEWAEKKLSDGWMQLKCKNCHLYIEWVRPLKRKGRKG